MRSLGFAALLFPAAAFMPLGAQHPGEFRGEYERRLQAADRDSATVRELVAAAEASRFMREFGDARLYLRIADLEASHPEHLNLVLRERLWMELATGGGVEGVQRVFREERREREIPPVIVAGWSNSFPEFLVGGEFDELIDRLSEDAEDPDYRCRCWAPKAWMHRAAGRMERSRAYWDSLNAAREEVPDFAHAFDEAHWRARLARDLARAGRFEACRRELERAMVLDVSAFQSVTIRRRRAQTYAELGEVERAVRDLEFLLSVPSPVTVHTLESRLTWEIVRDHPAFQALLARHADEGHPSK